ncbi:hypothetical protein QFZ49_005644 [Streptomyces turgidiscabies]|uniref:Integrase n=2 Tax=Streptomyces turgidiscabies TaxID=85558 RepID=A0ABU0RX01_9ACTN|nr:hypothetical protein [Streptomyces turgidiscabies]
MSATLSLLAKNDIKVVQERPGHSSRQITSDTYTSVLPQLMTAEAESTIATVPCAERKASPKKKDQDGLRSPLKTPRQPPRGTTRPLMRAPRRRRDPLAPGWPLDQDSLIH